MLRRAEDSPWFTVSQDEVVQYVLPCFGLRTLFGSSEAKNYDGRVKHCVGESPERNLTSFAPLSQDLKTYSYSDRKAGSSKE